MFFTSIGTLLAQQPLHALMGACWGLGVMLGRRVSPPLSVTAVETYRILPGPKLELMHTLNMNWRPHSQDVLVCSPDWRHVAFAAGLSPSKTHLVVCKVPVLHTHRDAVLPAVS